MKTYCENPLCEAPAVKEVPVSVTKPADQKRSLCATCSEAYTWGVQHGRKSEQMYLSLVERFLQKRGFIVLGWNQDDPHPGLPFEAWAYQGPLDFSEAAPVTFGLGHDVKDCLSALNQQLNKSKDTGKMTPVLQGLIIAPPPKETGPEPLWRVVYTIDVNALNAKDAAEFTHRIMTDPDSMAPVLDIIDARGKVTRIDLSKTENHSGKE